MSTKTTFKRIALVAVATLGFGMLSVVPSSAAITSVTGVSVVTTAPVASTATGTLPAPAGTAITADLSITIGGTVAVGTAVWTETFRIVNPNGTDVTTSGAFTSATPAGWTATNTAGVYSVTAAVGQTVGTYKIGAVTFSPTMAGVYLIRAAASAITGDVTAETAEATATTGSIYVSGAGATVSTSGLGTSTIGAVTGGNAKVNFGLTAGVGDAVFNITTSGVGSIQVVEKGTGSVGTPTIVGIAGTIDWT